MVEYVDLGQWGQHPNITYTVGANIDGIPYSGKYAVVVYQCIDSLFVMVLLELIILFSLEQDERLLGERWVDRNFNTRLVCPNFGNPALNSSF